MTCKFCDRFWDRFWNSCEAWERARSNDADLLARESDQSWELIQQASALTDSDPAGAFRLNVNAADAGSVWSMAAVGWQYWSGTGVAADLGQAQAYYRRAVAGGSLMAGIHYARLLAEDRHNDGWEVALKDGLAADFVPARFWLARLRYGRCNSPEVVKEIRPMLQHAAREGHPGAQQMLSRMLLTGNFGLHEIPRGLILVVRGALRFADPRNWSS